MEAGCKVREGDGRQSRKAVGTWAELFFGHAMCLAGSYFLNQGLNPVPVVKASSSNHWTAREVLKQILCFGS